MKTIKLHSTSQEVEIWQKMLIQLGYMLALNSEEFDNNTHDSTKLFQAVNGLYPDGVVGEKTWELFVLRSKLLNYSDYKRVASEIGCEKEAIMAVSKVESPHSGFYLDGRPRILFEGHVFYSQLKNVGIDPEPLSVEYPTIVYQKWTHKHYKGEGSGMTTDIDDEYERLDIARTIHEDAALKSASWGKYQVMGFNYNICGYPDLNSFIMDAQASESAHLNMFVEFIKNKKLEESLRTLNWEKFALKYNGKGYKKHKYDERIAEAYKFFKSLKLV